MKFLIDNNLPPVWAVALTELSKNEVPCPEVVALRSKFAANTPDHEWIDALGHERGWCILSQDRFGKGDLERAALRLSGLNVFRLNKAWNSHDYWTKTHCIVRWWPRILQQADMVSASLIEVPWKYGAHGRFNLQPHR